MQKVIPFLWFNNNMDEALAFYTGIFKTSKIISQNSMPGADGKTKLFTATFQLDSQEFISLNWEGGQPFSNAISFFISCDTQEEIDHYWYKLIADGGQEVQCGWLKDKFGISWQVVPPILGELMSSPDRAKAQRVMQAMMRMVKIDIAGLKKAAEE